MTPEQKKAIQALNRLKNFKDTLTEEEYFTLLEFVFAPPSQTQYVPIYPTYPTTPIEPWYRVQPYSVSMNGSVSATHTDNPNGTSVTTDENVVRHYTTK